MELAVEQSEAIGKSIPRSARCTVQLAGLAQHFGCLRLLVPREPARSKRRRRVFIAITRYARGRDRELCSSWTWRVKPKPTGEPDNWLGGERGLA